MNRTHGKTGFLCRGLVMLAVAGALQAGTQAIAAEPPAGTGAEMQLLHVQGNIYMITGLEANVTVQVGEEGILFVDTPPAALVEQAIDLLRPLTQRPVRYVIATHADAEHIGGSEALMLSGTSPAALAALRRMGIAAGGTGGGFTGEGVTLLGHENVLNRITDRSRPAIAGATINSEYYLPSKDFFMNGDAIVVHHAPNAHSDGDSFVYFRRADVVIAGDLFTPGRFPEIDLENGGSIQGLISAVNRMLEITVPAAYQEAGTYVIPGHGRLCDEADLVEFREMITIVRDRVQHMRSEGMTLEQVQAARPTLDYDTTYGGVRGGPTAEAFVAAVYRSLESPPQGAE